MLDTRFDLAEINDVCYALIYKDALFSTDDVTSTFPSSITNLLQEYSDVFLAEVTLGLPPIRGIASD
jgi:hypothetical protein